MCLVLPWEEPWTEPQTPGEEGPVHSAEDAGGGVGGVTTLKKLKGRV